MSETEQVFDKTDIGQFMGMMDVVDVVRRQDVAVKEQLSFDEQKKAVKEKLRKTYAEMGVEVSDSQLDRAIEDSYSRRWEFQPPKPGFQKVLANLYVDRGKITKRIIIPSAVAITVIAGIYGITTVGIRSHKKSIERGVENRVEEAYGARNSLENDLTNLLGAPQINELPENESNELKSNAVHGISKLKETDPFFTEFCPKGQADDAVTRENHKDVESKLNAVNNYIGEAKTGLHQGKTIIQRQGEFLSIKNSLENLLTEVKTVSPPAPLINMANASYTAGIESIKNRQIDSARNAQKDLSKILTDSKDFSYLREESVKLYLAASEIAKEQEAKESVESLKKRTDNFLEVADVNNLRNSVLSQEYRIEVMNKKGMLTALWRQSNDNPSRNKDDEDPRGKVFYLVAQAISPSGEAVPVKLKNIETGNYDTVKIWGERIPHEIYLRLKKDKMDNGLLDNSAGKFENRYYGEKKKGYINFSPIMKDNKGDYLERAGQITEEENNWRRR